MYTLHSTRSGANTRFQGVVTIPVVVSRCLGVGLDSRQFSTLYEKYRSVVHTIAKGVVQDDGLADDIAQEVFVRLHKMDRVDYPYAWLRRVTRRLALNWKRDRKRRSEILDNTGLDWLDGYEGTVVEELVAHDMVQWVETEIETWPVEFRETALMLVRGAKPNEIQEALKLNSGTVSSRIHRIRKRLEGFFIFEKQDP